ncbi:pistil-specific extensin-like protein [Magnolia sinica]|uniref:pistil-specific extensin-like protein n=1 Tax=Magnolia sinica TaxID=86752 RepID=UPI00265842E3|nr:pistil-specific extensin-like protein [Magnolia sinica]
MGRALALVIAACLLIGCNAMEAWKKDAKVIRVGGKVMCQDCNQSWNEWVHAATPLKGCRVAITCMERGRVVYYTSDETDEEGEFEMHVNKYINGKELNCEECRVRLMSSPDPQCNVLTNFGGGQTGVKLAQPSHVHRDLIKYTLTPFYFTSLMCDEPDTTISQDQGSNY